MRNWLVILYSAFVIVMTAAGMSMLHKLEAAAELSNPKTFYASFDPGDCLVFTSDYDYNETPFPKFIIGTVGRYSYMVFDFNDTGMTRSIALRFSTAQEFKKVQCNQGKP